MATRSNTPLENNLNWLQWQLSMKYYLVVLALVGLGFWAGIGGKENFGGWYTGTAFFLIALIFPGYMGMIAAWNRYKKGLPSK